MLRFWALTTVSIQVESDFMRVSFSCCVCDAGHDPAHVRLCCWRRGSGPDADRRRSQSGHSGEYIQWLWPLRLPNDQYMVLLYSRNVTAPLKDFGATAECKSLHSHVFLVRKNRPLFYNLCTKNKIRKCLKWSGGVSWNQIKWTISEWILSHYYLTQFVFLQFVPAQCQESSDYEMLSMWKLYSVYLHLVHLS